MEYIKIRSESVSIWLHLQGHDPAKIEDGIKYYEHTKEIEETILNLLEEFNGKPKQENN